MAQYVEAKMKVLSHKIRQIKILIIIEMTLFHIYQNVNRKALNRSRLEDRPAGLAPAEKPLI